MGSKKTYRLVCFFISIVGGNTNNSSSNGNRVSAYLPTLLPIQVYVCPFIITTIKNKPLGHWLMSKSILLVVSATKAWPVGVKNCMEEMLWPGLVCIKELLVPTPAIAQW
jgi:hypothetical protein